MDFARPLLAHEAQARSALGALVRLASVCAMMATPYMVQAQSVTTIPSSAEVISEVTLSKTRDMDFGRVIVPRNGRIDMTAEETPTCTPNNGLTLLDACETASFDGRAGTGFQIRISVPSGRRIDLTGPGQDLRLRRMEVGAGSGLTFERRVNRHFEFIVTDPATSADVCCSATIRQRASTAARSISRPIISD